MTAFGTQVCPLPYSPVPAAAPPTRDLRCGQVHMAYPINALRNLAWRAAPTRFALLLDADFVPSPQFQVRSHAV